VKITPDTNLLVRVLVDDDPRQADLARSALRDAELVVLTAVSLCEVVWVLRSGYRLASAEMAAALRALLAGGNVSAERGAIDAGLAQLDAGGDFADGVIAFEGEWLGAEEFVSFDRRAVALLETQGKAARLLA
jgi:predicted nucleic-acid-binding protein